MKISRAELARNIVKVSKLIHVNPQELTRKIYLNAAQFYNLRVIRSKQYIQDVGGFNRAKRLVK